MTHILLAAHGSRDEVANAEFVKLAHMYRERARSKKIEVEFGFLSKAQPDLRNVLARLATAGRKVVVVPVFLSSAGHVKRDLPRILLEIRTRFAGSTLLLTAPFGADEVLVESALARASTLPCVVPRKAALVLLSRGSSDPDARIEPETLVSRLRRRSSYGQVRLAFCDAAAPQLTEALQDLWTDGANEILVVPHLLFPGLLIQKARRDVAEFQKLRSEARVHLASHIGPDARLLDLIDRRIIEGLDVSPGETLRTDS